MKNTQNAMLFAFESYIILSATWSFYYKSDGNKKHTILHIKQLIENVPKDSDLKIFIKKKSFWSNKH
jgi:hypothetical protein